MMSYLFRHLRRWHRRYFKTLEFRPRCNDMVITICYGYDDTMRLIYRDLGQYIRRQIQLNEHGLFSYRRHYRMVSETEYEYSCLILSSRSIC